MIALYAIGLQPASAEGLRALRCGDMTLLVGDIPPPLSADALRAHDSMLRRIAEQNDPCLPARFGAVAQDDEALVREITRRTPELLEALELVRGREQMTLRVHGNPVRLPPTRGGPGTRWLEERRRMVRIPELDPLRVALLGIERAERTERHESAQLVASVYHLIDRGRASDYRDAVARTPIDGMGITVSGPWPAWSFVPDLVLR